MIPATDPDAAPLIRSVWYAGEGEIGWRELDPQDDPTVVQQAEAVWCGAATGQMLLMERGIPGTQYDIIQLTGVTDAGINDQILAQALQILDTNDQYHWQGGVPIISEGDDETVFLTLISTGSWGAVILTQFRYLHMVVVDGLDEQGRVLIRDPAQGRRYRVRLQEFLTEYWTRIAVWAFPTSPPMTAEKNQEGQ